MLFRETKHGEESVNPGTRENYLGTKFKVKITDLRTGSKGQRQN